MMGNYQSKKSDRFAFGLWTVMNTGRDPFGAETRPPMSGLDVITELGRRNVYAFEMHAEDLVPERASAAERDRLLAEARKRMADNDIVCVNCGANVFGHPVYKDGALTSHDPKVRQLTLQRYMNAIDVGVEVGAKLCNLWWGRDGVESDAGKDPFDAIKWLREGLNYLQSYIDKQGYTGFRLAIEPKPNEPRGDIYIPTVGHALGLIATLNKPENCGLVVEVAHSRMAGLNAYHDVAQPLEQNKLFGMHLNGQKTLRYDQDLRFGCEDLKEAFFIVKLLEEHYKGAISFDAHAYRSADRQEVWDFVEGCMRTYLILKEKVQRFNADAEIQGLLKDLRMDGQQTPPPEPAKLKEIVFDWDALAKRKLHHEKLDQLTQELILGVR